MVLDRDLRIHGTNDAFEELFGSDAVNVEEVFFHAFPDPDHRSAVYAHLESKLLTGDMGAKSVHATTRGGDVVGLICTMIPFEDDVFLMICNVTERALSNEIVEILRRTMRPSAILNVVHGGVTEIVEANKAFQEMVGMDLGELRGRTLDEVIGTGGDIGGLLAYGGQLVIESPHVGRSLEIEFTPLTSSGALIAIEDVTEDRSMATSTSENEQRFQAFMDTLPLPAFVRTRESRFVYINRMYQEMLGPYGERFLGQSVHDAFGDVEGELVATEDAKAMEECVTTVDEEITDYRGERRNLKVFRFTYGDGARSMVGGVAMDVTERRAREARLHRTIREREVLLQEVHHRVRNNMAIVNSLIGIEMSNMPAGRCRDSLYHTSNRIIAMSLVHEALFDSDDLSDIDLRSHLEALTGTMLSNLSADGFSWSVTSPDVGVGIDVAMPLSLVINELVAGTVERSNDGDSLEIVISTHGSELVISYRDGTEGPGSQVDGLGMRIVDSLVRRQMKGSWTLTAGNRIDIVVPLFDSEKDVCDDGDRHQGH